MSDNNSEHKVNAELERSIKNDRQVEVTLSLEKPSFLTLSSLSPCSVSLSSPSKPEIFKLDINCFEELFEWLALRDLLVLRETSKRFKQIADFYLKEYYPAVKLGVGKWRICDNNFDQFHHFDSISKKLIKQISFGTKILTDEQIDDFKNVLNQVETIEISSRQIQGEFHENFLQFCWNLKHLCIWNVDGNRLIGSGNEWLFRHYPKLEHLELDDSDIGGAIYGQEVIELKTFFELNPNIRMFNTSVHFLWMNRNWLKGAEITLDLLNLYGDCDAMDEHMDEFYVFLTELFKQGFYKRLNLCESIVHVNRISSLNGIEVLHLEIANSNDSVELPPLKNVKELSFRQGSDALKALANDFNNVEQICMVFAEFSDILPFIRHSARIKQIEVYQLGKRKVDYFINGIIDVIALDKERQKLNRARKVTVYVDEQVFLATKWAGMTTSSTLVAMKRSATRQWTHRFY